METASSFSDNSFHAFNSLESLGWNIFFQEHHAHLAASYPQCLLGRVCAENKTNYAVFTPDGEWTAEATGKLLFSAETQAELPHVGDWVYITPFDDHRALIHHVLPRSTRISRKSVGRSAEEQIIATNLDRVFIVQGLDDNFNLRRLERYLTMTDGTGIEPIIILNKADTHPAAEDAAEQTRAEFPSVQVLLVSASTGNGCDAVRLLIPHSTTVAIVGSSGVGKSTLLNQLAGATVQSTNAVRETDSKGRHTTTRRELFRLPAGGLVIDTPGMRELQLWNADEGMATAFADIEERAEQCRFHDCTHIHENGCAVRLAMDAGEFSEAHFQSYRKLQRERRYELAQHDMNEQRKRKEREKRLTRLGSSLSEHKRNR